MYRTITSLCQTKDQQVQIQFIVFAPTSNEMEIRNMLEKHKVITLHMEAYKEEPKNTKPVVFDIAREGQKYQFFFQTNSYKETCEMLVRLGFDVTFISHHETPIPEQEAQKTIQEIKSKVAEEKKKEKEIEMQMKREEEKKFSDSKREKVVATIDQTIEDIQELKEIAANVVKGNDLRQLTNYQEELKKVRRGTNVEKMLQILEETFSLISKIQNQYLAALKAQEKPIRNGSAVTDIDVIQEYKKYQKSVKVMQAGMAKGTDDNYYVLFGKIGMYLRFLKKDIVEKTNNMKNILVAILELVSYTLIFLAITFGLYFFIKKAGNQEVVSSVYKQLFYVGIAGLSLSLSKLMREQTSFGIFIQMLGAVLIYFFVSWFLEKMFGL